MQTLAGIQKELQTRGVGFNPHTTTTLKDVETQVAEFESLLMQRKPVLEQELEFKKNRGITPQQFAEMEVLFHKYDADKSGTIEKRELRVCMYSLGEDMTGAELDAGLTKYGKNGQLTLPQFKNYMISIMGVIDTKQSILDNLKFIARDKDHCAEAALRKHLPGGVVDGMLRVAPLAADGFDYARWTQVMFSR